MASQTYETLNKAWKSTCRTVLGDEIGELEDYGEWLSLHMDPFRVRKSCVSGSDVYCAVPYYCENGKFISLEEVDFNKRFEPLTINEIKDIDSIAQAIKERFAYCGNVVLENSKNVYQSSNVQNSYHILNSNFTSDCEYLAYCSNTRRDKYCFGVKTDVESNHVIRGFEGHRNSRCFEEWFCITNSDVYCSFGVWNSQDMMFCFNLDNKRLHIGNIQLTKDRYLSIKAKLLEDIRGELIKKKSFPSLMDMIVEDPRLPELEGIPDVGEDFENGDKLPIEQAFSKTTKIVLGKGLHGIDHYEKWMMRHIPKLDSQKSVISGKSLYQGRNTPFFAFPKSRLVKEREAYALGGKLKMDEEEIKSVSSIRKSLWKIALVYSEGYLGEKRNVFGVPIFNTCINCYCGPLFAYNENCAFCYWSRESKNMLGSAQAHSSSFCIDSYYSTHISRAFEVDSCSNCSDIYFCHNCENAKDSMFCFNAKNLRNAIGNAQYSPDEYRKVKTSILEQVVSELEEKKELKWDIYNIGCHD